MTLSVVFRVDASNLIGVGHIMRCLTLADGLALVGGSCSFVTREHSGNLIDHIRRKGHAVHPLPTQYRIVADGEKNITSNNPGNTIYKDDWLGASEEQDCALTKKILQGINPDFLIVDHYALGSLWESQLRPLCKSLIVIDDLANRPHKCDLLLDQTYGRSTMDYKTLVSRDCILLCGSQYALLRPDFSKLRSFSLQRRNKISLNKLLLAMGGVDKDNITSLMLAALKNNSFENDLSITVVLGKSSPHIEEVLTMSKTMPWDTVVKVQVEEMAKIMAESDFAIGAAGTTSWERCCMGLPSLLVVLADNQKRIAGSLERANAASILSVNLKNREIPVLDQSIFQLDKLRLMSEKASKITDGLGVDRVISALLKLPVY